MLYCFCFCFCFLFLTLSFWINISIRNRLALWGHDTVAFVPHGGDIVSALEAEPAQSDGKHCAKHCQTESTVS